jgi:hypothetical protein
MQFDTASTHYYYDEEIPELVGQKTNSIIIVKPTENGERHLAIVDFNKKPAYFHKGYAKIQNAKFFDTIRYLLDNGGADYFIDFPYIFIRDFGKYKDADGLEVAIGLLEAVELLLGIYNGKDRVR